MGGGGGQKIMCAKPRSPLRGPGSSRAYNALSCYLILSHIFNPILTGVGVKLTPPPPHCTKSATASRPPLFFFFIYNNNFGSLDIIFPKFLVFYSNFVKSPCRGRGGGGYPSPTPSPRSVASLPRIGHHHPPIVKTNRHLYSGGSAPWAPGS